MFYNIREGDTVFMDSLKTQKSKDFEEKTYFFQVEK